MKSGLIIFTVVISLQTQSITTVRLNGIQAGFGDDRRSTLFLNRVGQCKGFEKLPVFVPDCRIVQLNSTHYVISGLVILHEPYDHNISSAVWIEQCNATGHCKPFTRTIPFDDACAYLKSVDPALVSLLLAATPEFKCPFRVGIYRFNDFVTDNMVFLYLSPHVSNDWRIIISVAHQGHIIHCLALELSIYNWEEMLVKTKYQ